MKIRKSHIFFVVASSLFLITSISFADTRMGQYSDMHERMMMERGMSHGGMGMMNMMGGGMHMME